MLVCLMLMLTLTLTLAGPAHPEGVDRSITETTLQNGLRVLLMESPGSGLVCSNVFVRAGAVRESLDLNGAAHFLEHLLFNGTTTRSQEELYTDVDLLGAYNNATTRKDYAAFVFIVGTESAAEGLSIQADMLFRSTLPADKFEKERGIVDEEIAKDLSEPDYLAQIALEGALYRGTPYELPVLGTPVSIRGLQREKVLEYYHAYYVPSNMVMLVIGDFETEKMLEIVKRTFGEVEGSQVPAAPVPLPPLVAGRWVHAPMHDAHRRLLVRIPAPLPSDPGFVALELLAHVVGQSDASRLRRGFGAAPRLDVQELGCGVTLVGGRAYLDVSAVLAPDADVDAVAARLAGELRRVAEDGVEPWELHAAQVSARSEESSLRQQLSYYGFMRGDLILNAEAGYLNDLSRRYRELTVTAVNEVARTYLLSPAALVVATGPDLEPADEPATPERIGFTRPPFALPPAGESDAGVVSAAPGPPPRTDRVVEPRTVTLSSGLTVVLACDPSSDVLAVHLMALGRSFREPEGLDGITDFLHRLLTRGAGELDRSALNRRLTAIGATVKTHDDDAIPYDDYYTVPEFSFVRLETLDDFHREAFGLLAAMVTRPALAEGDVEDVRREMIALSARRQGTPRAVGETLWRQALYGEASGAARALGGTGESLPRITREDLLAYHRTYFQPSNLVLTVITSLPDDVVIEALEEAFPATLWPAPSSALEPWSPRLLRPAPDREPRHLVREVGQAQSWITMGHAFDFDPADEAPLEVLGIVLSDRLSFHLRERLGLAYMIGASFSTPGDRGVVSAWMGTQPGNLDTALAGMAAQVDSLSIVELGLEDVTKAASSRIGRMRMRRVSRMGQAFYLSMDVLGGDPLGAHEEKLRRMREVTAADVRRVASAYVHSDRFHQVIVK